MRVFRLILLLFLAGLVTSANAEPQLTAHMAEYKLKMSVLGGRLNTRLVTTDDGYEATHRIKPTGMAALFTSGEIEEISGFDTSDEGVFPTHYRSKDSLTKDKTDATVAFDWSTGAMTGVVNGEVLDDELAEVVHDRVSIQYQLMFDMLNGGPGEKYILYDIDEFKTLNVNLIGEKDIKVPAGKYRAIGIQHQVEGSSRITTLWCVPELDYLPVIIEQHRKGKLKMRARLSKYTELGSEPQANVIDN